MTQKNFGDNTIQLIKSLHKDGINKFSVIMRHSARHYNKDITMEPFQGLTDAGKELALRLGTNLPAGLHLRLFSSYIGRCIETAYLIDKGYTNKGGRTESPLLLNAISPSYIVDFKKAIEVILKMDTPRFIRSWIEGDLSPEVIQDTESVTTSMLSCIIDSLEDTHRDSIDIFITHDWNMYLLKELRLGLRHEQFGEVDYLEGVIIFKKNDCNYIVNHQTGLKRLNV